MKKKFYDVGLNPYTRDEKLFWWVPLAAAGLTAGASLINGSSSASAQREANRLNMQLNEQNYINQRSLQSMAQDFNSWQAKAARDWSSEEAGRQMDFQREMSQMLLDYQDPSNQVARVLAAGGNPATVFGNLDSAPFGVPSGASGSPVAASSSPLSAHPNYPMQPVNSLQGLSSAMTNAADVYSRLVSAKKTEAETSGIITDNEFKRVEHEMNLDLTRSEIRKNAASVRLADADAQVAQQKILESQQMVQNLIASKSETEARTKNLDIQNLYASDYYKAQRDEMVAKYNVSKQYADAAQKLIYADIAQKMGAANASNASAEASRAMASLAPFEREKLQAEKSFIDTQDKHEKVRKYLDWKYGKREREQALRAGEQNIKTSKEQEKKLNWENKPFVRGVNMFKDIAVGAAGVVGTVYGAGAIGKAAAGSRGVFNVNNSTSITAPGM